jgi:hypothetical protein
MLTTVRRSHPISILLLMTLLATSRIHVINNARASGLVWSGQRGS